MRFCAEYKEKLKVLNLGLEDRLTAKVGLLSGGQRQALTLLMATLVKPKVLLLDEHTAALDPKTAENVLKATDRIVAEGKLTTIMVTHNMRDAIAHGNRLIMMNDGKVVLDIKGEENKKTGDFQSKEVVSFFRLFEKLPVFAVTRFFQLVVRDELEGSRVDAVAQSALVQRTVGEDVAQVGVSLAAADFGSFHAKGLVPALGQLNQRLGEGWPAATGIVLVQRGKEGFPTDHVDIDPFFEEVVVLTCIRRFSCRVLGHGVLHWRQPVFQIYFFVHLGHLIYLDKAIVA